MTKTFEKNFSVISDFVKNYLNKKEENIEKAVEKIITDGEFEKIKNLLIEINAFESPFSASIAVKTRDLMNLMDFELDGLTAMETIQRIKIEIKKKLSAYIESVPAIEDKKELNNFYILKWDILLKKHFSRLIMKNGEKYSNLTIYATTTPILMGIKWNDGKMTDDILGIKRIKNGDMNIHSNGSDYKIEKNKDFTIFFTDAGKLYSYSCNMMFKNSNPFYEFPTFLSYEEMQLIEDELIHRFPLELMLRELSVGMKLPHRIEDSEGDF